MAVVLNSAKHPGSCLGLRFPARMEGDCRRTLGKVCFWGPYSWGDTGSPSGPELGTHIYTCVLVHTHTHVHTHTCAFTHMHTHMHAHTYIHMYTHMHIHTHTHAHWHACTHWHLATAEHRKFNM